MITLKSWVASCRGEKLAEPWAKGRLDRLDTAEVAGDTCVGGGMDTLEQNEKKKN